MQTPPTIPHGVWVDLLPWLLGALLGASTRWIPLWQNRKVPDAQVHETDARAERTRAEARKLDADSSKSLGEIFIAMSEQLSESQRNISEQRSEHARRVQFLQDQLEQKDFQLERKSEQEEAARVRSHRAIAEIQRCVMTIRDYEEAMRNGNIQFVAFEFKTYEEIMGENKPS